VTRTAERDAVQAEPGQKSGVSDKQANEAAKPMFAPASEEIAPGYKPDWDVATQGRPPFGFKEQYNVYDSNAVPAPDEEQQD
jgi:hypothetical protein